MLSNFLPVQHYVRVITAAALLLVVGGAALSGLEIWLRVKRGPRKKPLVSRPPAEGPPEPAADAVGGTVTGEAVTGEAVTVGAAGTGVTEEPLSPASRRLDMTPDYNGLVVGRREVVARAVAALTGADDSARELVVLHGQSGFGKTTAAQLICNDPAVVSYFSGGTLWLRLDPEAWSRLEPETRAALLKSKIEDLYHSLAGQRVVFGDSFAAGFELGRRLEQRAVAGQPVLLVLDNLTEPDQVVPEQHFPGLARLVTTRSANLLPDRSIQVEVSEMDQHDARELLKQGLGELDGSIVDQLLRYTGGWALPTSLVNAYLRRAVRPGITVTMAARELVARLGAEGPEAYSVRTRGGRDTTIAAVIGNSLSAFDPTERQRFRELAVFPAELDIPLALVRLLWEATGGLTGSAANRLCAEFAELSLFTSHSPDHSVRLHPVIADYLLHDQGARLPRLQAALLDRVARRYGVVGGDGSAGVAVSPRPWWSMTAAADENVTEAAGLDYLWRQLCHHLAGLEAVDELDALLRDLRWVVAKAERVGAAAIDGDLVRSTDRTVQALRQAWSRELAQLGPVQPSDSYGDIVASRLGAVPELAAVATAYLSTLSHRPRLRTAPPWHLPDTNLETRQVLPQASSVRACAYAPGGRLLAVGCMDAAAAVWDLDAGTVVAALGGADAHTQAVIGVAFSPDGTRLATSGHDATAFIWDIATATRLVRPLKHAKDSWVTGVAFSADGTLLVTGGTDSTVRIWDTATGVGRPPLRHDSAVQCVAVSTDDVLAAGGSDGLVRLWAVATGEPLGALVGHDRPVSSVAFSADGTRLASASDDGTVRVWTVADRTCVRILRGHVGEVTSVALAPTGDWLVSGGTDQTVRVWELQSDRPPRVLDDHTFWVWAVAISPDGAEIASGSDDRTVRLWDGAGGARLDEQREGASGVAVAAAGTWLVTSGFDGGTVRRWDTGTAMPTEAWQSQPGWLTGIAIAHDDSWLVATNRNGTAALLRTSDGATQRTVAGQSGALLGVAIAPDDRWFVTIGADLCAWDAATGRQRWAVPVPGAQAVVIEPQGAWLATGGRDGIIRRWDPTGAARDPLPPRSGGVTALDISADGAWLAVGGEDRRTVLWDLRRQEEWGELTGHTQKVTAVAFSPDAEWVATTGLDDTLRVYRRATGQAVATMRVAGGLGGCQWRRDSTVIYAVGDRGLYAFQLDPS